MHPSDVLLPLAVSLAARDWTVAALHLQLRQRLPLSLSRSAAPLARSRLRAFPGQAAPDARLIARFLKSYPGTPRILAHARATGQRTAHPLDPPRFRPGPAPVPPLATPGDLADWLAITPDQLIRFADLRGLSARSADPFGPHYRHHLIPNANGQHRLIEEPKPFLKRLRRRILHGLLDRIAPHDAAHGFCPGRSCLTGAAHHAGEAMVVGFYIRDFFPIVPYPRLYALFRALGYPPGVAWPLTGLCTALAPSSHLHQPGLAAADALRQRQLPQGAPTSPALANLAARALDSRLAGLAASLAASYSRYADDLTFSGDARIAPILLAAVPQIAAEKGLPLNPAKTRATPAHSRQTVTGLTVNAHVNLPRLTYDRLKATLHHLENPADPRRADPTVLARLSGQIAWAEQANPARGLRLRARFNAL